MKTLLILFYKNVWDFKKERGIANYYLRRIMYKKKKLENRDFEQGITNFYEF